MKIYMCSPVRSITPAFEESVAAEVQALEAQGHKVWWPLRDTSQGQSALDICIDNRAAIREADEFHVCWDGASQGVLFDLGIAFALGKRINAVVGRVPRMTHEKSFANLIHELDEAGGDL
jgi:nucleoside 2-deoxyribosyltransferase